MLIIPLRPSFWSSLLGLASLFISPSFAAQGTWSGATNGAWDMDALNWSGVSGTPWDIDNGFTNSALFNATGATPTVSGTVYANAITFSSATTLSGGTITLGGTAPALTVATSANSLIASSLAGTNGFTKSGVGTLGLSAGNALTGTVVVNEGTLSLNGAASASAGRDVSASELANANVTVNAGATLLAGNTNNGFNSHRITKILTLNGGTIAANGVSGNNNGQFALDGLAGARVVAGGATNSTISASLGLFWDTDFEVGINSTLTLSGRVGNYDGSNWGFIDKQGAGTLILANTNGNGYGQLILRNGAVEVANNAWSANSWYSGAYMADFQGSSTLRWGSNNNRDISSSGGANSGIRIADGVTATLDVGTNNVTLGSAFTLGAAGTAALAKAGSGTLTLSAINTNTGGVSLREGTLALSNASAAGSGSIRYDGNSTLRTLAAMTLSNSFAITSGVTGVVDVSSNNTTLSGVVSGSGGLTKVGSGTLTLSGTNTYTGLTRVSDGILALTGRLSSSSSSSIDLAGGNLLINRPGDSIIQGVQGLPSGAITGTGGIQLAAGNLVLKSANTFSGGITNTGGQIFLENASGLGTGTLTLNMDAAQSMYFNLSSPGNISNNITILKPGANNRPTYFTQQSTNNVVLAGDLNVASGNFLGFYVSGVTNSTFTLTGSNSFGADVATGSGANFRFGGSNAAGGVTWRPNTNATFTLLDGANFKSELGNTVRALAMEGPGSATFSGDVYVNYGTNAGTPLLQTPEGATLTFAGTMRGIGTVTKTGTGTVILGASDNSLRAYVLSAGTLQLSNLSSLGGAVQSSVLTLDGGSLRYTGSGESRPQAFTLSQNGGTLEASGTGALILNAATNVNLTGAGARTLTLAGTSTATNTLLSTLADSGVDPVSVSKTGAGTWILSGSNTYTGSTTVNDGTLVIVRTNLTATIRSNSVAVAFSSVPSAGTTYLILPGGLAGNSLVSTPVTGLGSGQTATVVNAPNLVVQVTDGVAGPTFESAYPGIDPLEINPANGLSYLMNYALGGTGSNSTPALPVLTSDGTNLTLTANIRDIGQGVNVVGEYAYDLAGPWLEDKVSTTMGGSIVPNTRVTSFSIQVESAQPRKFLRLRATLSP